MEQVSNSLVRICCHQFIREETYHNMITRQGMKDLAAKIRKYLKFMAMVQLQFGDNSIRALRESDSKQTNQDREASRPHLQSRDSKLKSI